jgi:hypothetical protein
MCALTEGAFLAIVDHGYHAVPWQEELRAVIRRHSRSPRYDPSFSLADELSALGLLTVAGSTTLRPEVFRQPVADYIEQFHSTASLARLWMSAGESAEFDRVVGQIVAPHATDGILELSVVAELTWGRPARKAGPV